MPASLMVRTAGDGELTWVLLAANGRPLARSASAYRTDEALAAAWRELVADRAVLSIRLARDGDGPDWWWTATLPARSVGGGGAARPTGGAARAAGSRAAPGTRGAAGSRLAAAGPAGAVGVAANGGVVVARSARGYLRPDQCRGGASGFVSALSGFARRLR
ncbi:hypothetical protein [Catenulispora pinisilvae]|uniref:hypothetical protein n=1 Tax=Catenulispora pinisilvae TaxID=2705253 RepID=UPI0018927A8E|nr:hypothetical protein [Catenulispora pinisilvae]